MTRKPRSHLSFHRWIKIKAPLHPARFRPTCKQSPNPIFPIAREKCGLLATVAKRRNWVIVSCKRKRSKRRCWNFSCNQGPTKLREEATVKNEVFKATVKRVTCNFFCKIDTKQVEILRWALYHLCLATNQVAAICANTDFWLDKITQL